MIPAPPRPFPAVTRYRLAAGALVARIHDVRFGPVAFNPGLGSPSRFAPLRRSDGSVIPHLYAAQDYECAAHETVFHDVPYDAAHKVITSARLDPLVLSWLKVRRDLDLAALFQPDLHAWRVTRADLIDTWPTAYTATVQWALAIHAVHDVAGLIWTSRRCDPATALILYGDRLGAEDLEVVSSERIIGSALLFGQMRQFAARAGITITL